MTPAVPVAHISLLVLYIEHRLMATLHCIKPFDVVLLCLTSFFFLYLKVAIYLSLWVRGLAPRINCFFLFYLSNYSGDRLRWAGGVDGESIMNGVSRRGLGTVAGWTPTYSDPPMIYQVRIPRVEVSL